MAVPGTGSTNQSLTFAAAKKVAGKAHTSNLKELYEEVIPSNVQLNTSIIFGQPIPTASVSTDTLYQRFSASGGDYTVEYVEFYLESISGTTYDANTGTFGSVGFGGGDESQNAGPHGYQLVLTSSYETNSNNPLTGSGYFVNDQVIHESNGGLQLVHPLFGPQSGNKYYLSLYTDHPDNGGTQIPETSPMEWSVDYYNGVVFFQDYRSTEIPKYARAFIYIGKYADQVISEASSSGGGGSGISDVVDDTTPQLGGNLDLNSNNITGTGDISVTGNITSSGTVSASMFYGDGSNLTGISSGGGGSVAGSNTHIQFNDNGSFGGSANLTWDGSRARVTGSIEISGSLTASSNVHVYGSLIETSERALKTNITSLPSQMNNIMNLNPVSFNWNRDNKKSMGFIAEEVNEIYPELVYKDGEGNPRGIEYTKLVSILAQGIKELKTRIHEQEEQIQELFKIIKDKQ